MPTPALPVEGLPSTVLYVEDNPANVKLMERILERRPHVSLVVAMQGRVALELAREHRPALVLLDLNLPDISGEEVLRRLLSDPRTATTAVVMISGDAMPEQSGRLRELGAADYITKPLDIARVLDIVDELGVRPIG